MRAAPYFLLLAGLASRVTAVFEGYVPECLTSCLNTRLQTASCILPDGTPDLTCACIESPIEFMNYTGLSGFDYVALYCAQSAGCSVNDGGRLSLALQEICAVAGFTTVNILGPVASSSSPTTTPAPSPVTTAVVNGGVTETVTINYVLTTITSTLTGLDATTYLSTFTTSCDRGTRRGGCIYGTGLNTVSVSATWDPTPVSNQPFAFQTYAAVTVGATNSMASTSGSEGSSTTSTAGSGSQSAPAAATTTSTASGTRPAFFTGMVFGLAFFFTLLLA